MAAVGTSTSAPSSTHWVTPPVAACTRALELRLRLVVIAHRLRSLAGAAPKRPAGVHSR